MIAQSPKPAIEQQESIRVIRDGKWVILASEAEMTEAEQREQYCRMFQIYEMFG